MIRWERPSPVEDDASIGRWSRDSESCALVSRLIVSTASGDAKNGSMLSDVVVGSKSGLSKSAKFSVYVWLGGSE